MWQTLVLGLISFIPTAGQTDSLIESTVWIRAGDRSTGTGFVVDAERRWVLTARHVVGDQEKVEVFFRDPAFSDHHRDEYLKSRTEQRKAGRCVSGTVIAKQDVADLALIKLDSLPKDAPVIRFAEFAPSAGDSCRCTGHRQGVGTLWLRTDGVIRQSGELREGYAWAGVKLGVGVRVHYAQLPIDVGDSGAAVVNAQGKLIGLVSAFAGRTPAATIVISADEIRQFLGQIQKTSPPEAKSSGEVPQVVRATVWVRPEATDGRFAGVLFSWDKGIILTTASAIGGEERATIIFPKFRDGRLVSEEAEYSDRVGLHLSGHLQPAVVLHVDKERDLALLKAMFVPETSKPIHLAGRDPKTGEKVLAVSHPTGVEMRWLLSSGTVRGAGKVVLHPDRPEKASAVGSLALQMPHQGNCSGGPVVNMESELISILASREGPRQELAYAVNIEEHRKFMSGAHPMVRPVDVEDYLTMFRKYRLADAVFAQRPIADGLKKHPDDIRLNVERLMALDSDQKIRTGLASLRGKPKTATEFSAMGRVRQRLGDLSEARKLFEEALKIDEKCVSALVGRASLAKGEEAEKDLRAASLIDPTFPEIYRVRAAILPRTTDDERKIVIDELARLLELEPYDLHVRVERAGLLYALREFKKAEGDYLRLTELSPGMTEAWVRLADARLKQGKQPASVEAMRTAVRVDQKSLSRAATLILARAEHLIKDDPKDTDRVVEWLKQSLGGLATAMSPHQLREIIGWLEDPKLTNADRVARVLERLASFNQ
ncbi:tetratricopeptide repeat-containing S1 family peptidase [Zavarzinella formosa]|uniref:tetratricopeptide repeat-containing S1 family peptidase n=1 Tax=Zavarzinella formosa TaxID=360055 RepID=UPI0002F83CBD|nr:serine protease [Zavarzinella formosa]